MTLTGGVPGEVCVPVVIDVIDGSDRTYSGSLYWRCCSAESIVDKNVSSYSSSSSSDHDVGRSGNFRVAGDICDTERHLKT